MVKKVINVGVEGNDASGDPIREAFIKANENFNELYSAFGKGDGISITALEEGPDEVVPQSILIADALGEKYLAKTLLGEGINIINSDPTQLRFVVESSRLISDNNPSLANNLDASGFNIFRVKNPDQALANSEGVPIDSFAINKGYADGRYVNINGDTMTGPLNVPAGAIGNEAPRANEVLLRQGGFGSQMTGPLILRGNITDDDNPLTAVTKSYVDVTNYASTVNLYVSTQGDDNQFEAGDLRRGRSLAFAFKTVSAACRYAQTLINASPFTVGPYIQTLTYNNGELDSIVDSIELETGEFYTLTVTNDGNPTDPRDGFNIRAGQILKGKTSGAIVQIQELGSVLASTEEFLVKYVTEETLIEGEKLYYGDPVKDLQITIQIESGNYYEHYPIRVPPNVSIVGDELRRVIIRPRPGRSASNSTDFYFRRDTVFDSDLYPATQTYGYHYLTDSTKSLYSRTITPNLGGRTNASSILLQNKAFIQEEVIAYVNVVYDGLDYDETKCRRDTGIIIDALSYDLAFNSNVQSVKVAEAYYRGTQAAVVLGAEKTATLASLDKLKIDLLTFVSDSQSITNITTNIDTIKSIINAGIINVPLLEIPVPSGIDAGFSNARTVIYNNRAFLQAEIVAYINQQILNNEENPSSIWYRLPYDGEACLRDVGYIIDAVTYDLTYGGNVLSVQAAQAYYYGTGSILVEREIEPTLDAYNVLKTIIYNVATGTSFTPYQTNVIRVGGSPGTTASGTAASALVEIIRYALLNDGATPAVVNPGLSSITTVLFNNFTNIQANKSSIIDSNIAFINSNFFLYDSTLCKRDVGLIVDAICYDLVYGGFYRSLEAGNSYFESASSLIAITDQLTETSAAIAHIDTLAQKIILQQPITTSYQNAYPESARLLQVRNLPISAESSSTTIVTELIQFMLDIITEDSSINPPKNNEDVDVFLLNNANILSQITCQEHGGFMCVLDPLGQILTKSPYIYKSSSFSRSKNEKTFAGGVFVDAFTGNVAAEIYERVDQLTVKVQYMFIRQPLTPCAFWINGVRFQVDLITEWNQIAGTATVHINPNTPDDPEYTFITDSTQLFLPSTSIEFLSAGNNSMCLSDFTQINDLGYGIAAVNNGLVEAVSVFTYYNQVSYFADTGGQIRSVNGSSAHGNYALVAAGANPLEVPDAITLKYDMVVGAQIYSPGVPGDDYYNEADDLIIYIENLTSDYLPLNQSELEVEFGVAPNKEIYRYVVNNAQVIDDPAVPRVPTGTLYRLVLASTGLGSTGFTGINDHIPDGQWITLRQNTSLWISGLAKATATRPSTALVLYEYPEFVYRVIAFGNIAAKTGLFEWLGLTATIFCPGHGLLNGDEIVANFSAGTNGNPSSRYYIINYISSSQFSVTTTTPAAVFSEGIISFSSAVTEAKADLKENFRTINFTTYYDVNDQKVQPYTTPITSSSSTTNLYTSLSTINLEPTIEIKFTGTIGGVVAGTSYYVNDVYSATTFSISPSLVTITATQTAISTNLITTASTSSLVALNPIVFSGTTFGGITAGTTYWINTKPSGTTFTISDSLISRNATATTTGTNLITLSDVTGLVLNNPIKFLGSTFGNIVSGTIYYVSTISVGTNQITISSSSGGGTFTLSSATGVMTAYTTAASLTLSNATGSCTGKSTDAPKTLTTASGTMYGSTDINGSNYYTWGVTGSYKFAVRDISTYDAARINYGIANNKKLLIGWQGRIHQISKYTPSDVLTPYATVELDNLTGTGGLKSPIGLVEGGYKNTPNIKAVLPAGSAGDITVNISTVRVSGHDMLKVGSGGFNTTNFPDTIYGIPDQTPDQAAEVLEIGKGRVFYITTDENGNFRVGDFFKVDQGTGTVTFSASIAISNLDGLGFKRGVAVAEFSVDDSMFDNATDTVPTEQAVRSYIDRRLGLTHNGGIVATARLIPGATSGYMSLGGELGMKANMNLSGYRILNVATPATGSDATNKTYVDLFLKRQGGTRTGIDSYQMSASPGGILDVNSNKIINVGTPTDNADAANKLYVDTVAAAQNELREIGGVSLPNPITGVANNSLFVFNGTNFTWGQQEGDVLFTLSSNTLTSAIQPGVILNADINSSAAIDQSKLNMNTATTRANATGITQADRGLASFDSGGFNVTSGWVSLKSNGTLLGNLQAIGPLTVIGNSNASSTLTPDAVAFSTVVQSGGALYKSQFSTNGAIVRTGVDTYGIVAYDTTATNGTLVQRSLADGGFSATIINASTQLNVGGNKSFGKSADATPYLELYSPQGNLTLATRSGTTNIYGSWYLSSGATLEATYAADIAEYYQGDKVYEPGTVLMIGGEYDVTIAKGQGTTKVAGVVSTEAGYIMNGACLGEKNLVALQGRVPCKVVGKIEKGDLMVVGIVPGVAMASTDPKPGSIIGKALQNYDSDHVGTIEVMVGKH